MALPPKTPSTAMVPGEFSKSSKRAQSTSLQHPSTRLHPIAMDELATELLEVRAAGAWSPSVSVSSNGPGWMKES